MKKSVMSQLAQLIGWGENDIRDSDLVKIVRRACHDSFRAGQEMGLVGKWSSKYRRKAINDIINGPKKARKEI